MRLIDGDNIVEVAEHAYNEWNLAMAAADGKREINKTYKMQELCKAVKAVADNCPTIDAVPVVRCKDCKKAEDRGHEVLCSLIGAFLGKDDFCSYGERKDGDGNG